MKNIEDILQIIPHRYPMVMVDRVLELSEVPMRIVALKNVTINEPFFLGHFPERPVMPGVMMIEALAQTAVLCLYFLNRIEKGDDFYLTGVDKTKFRRLVAPGDQLRLEAEIIQNRGTYWKMVGTASVDGEAAVESTITAMIYSSSSEQ